MPSLSNIAHLANAVVVLMFAAVTVHVQLWSLKTSVSLAASVDSGWSQTAQLPPHHSAALGVFFVCWHQCSHAPLSVILL